MPLLSRFKTFRKLRTLFSKTKKAKSKSMSKGDSDSKSKSKSKSKSRAITLDTKQELEKAVMVAREEGRRIAKEQCETMRRDYVVALVNIEHLDDSHIAAAWRKVTSAAYQKANRAMERAAKQFKMWEAAYKAEVDPDVAEWTMMPELEKAYTAQLTYNQHSMYLALDMQDAKTAEANFKKAPYLGTEYIRGRVREIATHMADLDRYFMLYEKRRPGYYRA